jgi:hypothetical protein
VRRSSYRRPIAAGLADMSQKKKTIYRTYVEEWLAPLQDKAEDAATWDYPEDLHDEKLHVVRRVRGYGVENNDRGFSADRGSKWEKAVSFSIKMIGTFQKRRLGFYSHTFP